MAVNQKTLKKISERRHPYYRKMLNHWDFMESSYEGGREWFEDNIFQYVKEGSTEFTERKKRAYRFNHTREVVDLVNKYLFRVDVHRNQGDAPQSVKDFWKRTTLQGLAIDEFMRIASTKSSVGGRPWIIVDNANTKVSEGDSEADTNKPEPYAYVVRPQDVLDMSWDDRGNLNWISIAERKRDDEDPLKSSGQIHDLVRLWTREEWFLIGKNSGKQDNLKLMDQGKHGLGEVPAVPVPHTVSDNKWHTPALVADISYLDRATANYASNLDAIIQDQTFSQLAMPAQNVLPGDNAYNKVLEMGTKRIFLYDGESGMKPEFLSPDPRQAQLIIAAIQQLINEIYHSVGLAGERTKQDNAKGIDNSSGVAKSIDFERVTALLIAKADSLETVENKLTRLVALWAGDESSHPEEDLVAYSDTFDVRELSDELGIAMQLSLIDLPEEMRSEQIKVLLPKLFPNLSKDLKKKLEDEIDDWVKQQKENSAAAAEALTAAGGGLLGEAKRDRDGAGQKQSDTKARES